MEKWKKIEKFDLLCVNLNQIHKGANSFYVIAVFNL